MANHALRHARLRIRQRILLAAIVMAVLGTAGNGEAQLVIGPIRIPHLGGGGTHARDLNNHGQVVGESLTPDFTRRAFSWTRTGGIVDLGDLGRDRYQCEAWVVNDYGQVAGRCYGANVSNAHAFLWTPSAGMRDLGTLGGSWSQANDINAHGQVIGYSETSTGTAHPFSWTAAVGMVDLVPSTSFGAAFQVNDSGQVLGFRTVPGGLGVSMYERAFLWSASDGLVDIGAGVAFVLNEHGHVLWGSRIWSIGGTVVDVRASGGTALNDHDQVVGSQLFCCFPWSNPSVQLHGFSWTAHTGTVDLGTLPGGKISGASAVNNRGEVIGTAESVGGCGDRHVFFWTAAGGMIDLPHPGLCATYATALNERGEVLAASSEGGDVLWRVGDTVAPVITVPGPITTDATSPLGAVVAFVATATDVQDEVLPVQCVPASGSLFPVGMTLVECTATDSHGNTGIASFSVTVRSASTMLMHLVAAVTAANFQQSIHLLQNAINNLTKGNSHAACNQVEAFMNQVRTQQGKSLSVLQATAFLSSANHIRAALGCP
jgi:probable HAF family extracellular repeat protein